MIIWTLLYLRTLLQYFHKRPTPPFLVNLCPLRANRQRLCTGVPRWRAGLHASTVKVHLVRSRPSFNSLPCQALRSARARTSYLFWLGALSGTASTPDGQGLSEHHCSSASLSISEPQGPAQPWPDVRIVGLPPSSHLSSFASDSKMT